MRLLAIISLAVFLVSIPTLFAQPANDRRVVELIEDDSEALINKLNNDGGLDQTKIRQEFRDVYSGVSAIHVTPFQRFSANIEGWKYPIVEKPQAAQYRYLRFAWKRLGQPNDPIGIMIQLHSNNSWNHRYWSGFRSNQTATWGPMIQVDPKSPREWTVVTRDLFMDYGPMTITGLALTPMADGVAGLFDHFYLGQSIEDLDRASAEAFGKTPFKAPLALLELGELWEDLGKPDVKAAGSAVRKLTAGRKESVPYLTKMIRFKPAPLDEKKIAGWIDDLGHDEFQLREAAYRELAKLGDAAIRPLQQARAKASSLEQRSRIDELLKSRGIGEGDLTRDQLRLVRAVRVLEWAGTQEALTALDGLVKDGPDATIAPDIRQARDRLANVLKR